jgi:hypothetical protein
LIKKVKRLENARSIIKVDLLNSIENNSMLWTTCEEMLTMQGMYPLLIDGRVFIIEDRQNESIFLNRVGKSSESYRFHLVGVQHLDDLAKKISGSSTKYTDQSVGEYRYGYDGVFSKEQIDFLEGIFKNINKGIYYNETMSIATVSPEVEIIDKQRFMSSPLEEIKFSTGSNLKKIEERAFAGCSLRAISIPNGVAEIGDKAFYECKFLKTVTRPAGVTEVGNNAFSGCESLDNVVIPNGVTKIGDSAFWGCSSLQSVDVPASVTDIGKFSFGHNDNLKIRLPETLRGKFPEKQTWVMEYYDE